MIRDILIASATVLLLCAPSAQAQLIQYTVTGTIDGFDWVDLNFTDFEPDGDPPFAGGAPYVLTFVLNPSSPLTNSGPTFADYGTAVTNLLLDIDSGSACASGVIEGILETYSGPNQTWAPGSGAFGPGCAGTVPAWDVIDFNTFETQTVAFDGFEAVLFRFDGGFYSTFPPPLITPELTDAQNAFIQLRFFSVSGGPMPAFMGINGSIDAIATPEPGLGVLLAFGVLGLSGAAARRR